VRKSRTRIGLLARACFATELQRDLGNLSDAGRADRMTHCDESTRGAHGAATADVEGAVLDEVNALSFITQSGSFDVEKFLDRERIVHFEDIEF
jgi:hypothetical protein